MSSPTLAASGLPQSQQEVLMEYFQSICVDASQPNAPAPKIIAETPAWMVNQAQAIYSQKIQCPVSTRMTTEGLLTFEPMSSFATTASMQIAASPGSASSLDTRDRKSKAKVPRPANAFILYRQHQHPIIKAQFPGIVNNDISKKVAALWKNESEDVKATWKAKSEEAKQQHLQQHPDYSYQPRKPSEKKRRMTKRKMASTTAAVVFVDNNLQHEQTSQQPLPAFTFDTRDMSLASCNIAAMGDNSADAFSTFDDFINSGMYNQSPQALAGFAAANDLSIGLGFREIQPVGSDDLNMFSIKENQDGDATMDASLAPVLATGVGVMGPAGPFWENCDNVGLMMTDDQIQNQQFLNSANAKKLEQDRQELLFEQSQQWGVWQESPLFQPLFQL
uniref:Putative mating type 1-2-1 protein n=1 Tax=Venturia effusa TaxID=50376 RepID=A0A2L0PUX2_9PEZI|nr:putative mating type 1-2-1 protein [Venturia effusa]AUZ20791.1 putative mating type 1-2-1 protein [Venturia effusa]